MKCKKCEGDIIVTGETVEMIEYSGLVPVCAECVDEVKQKADKTGGAHPTVQYAYPGVRLMTAAQYEAINGGE